MTRPAFALDVERQQLAGHVRRRVACPRLQRVPARAAEPRERRMLATGPDVARDLRELIGRRVDAIVTLVFEIEIVTRDARDGPRLKPGEAGDPVVFVHDDVARAQVGEGAQRAAASDGRASLRATAVKQQVIGDHGQAQSRRDEPLAQRRLGEGQAVLRR